MSVIEKFIVASSTATTLEELFTYLCAALKHYGIESVAYCLLNDHPSMNLRSNWGVISSYPAAWMDHFVERNFIDVDPLLPFCFVASRAFTWNELMQTNYAQPEKIKIITNEIKSFGLTDVVGVPIHGPNSEVACLGLASSFKLPSDPHALAAMQALAVQFHHSYSRIAGGQLIPGQFLELTEREREILMWSAEGKSVYAIGEILSTSEHNVKYHLKKIYKKLGVTDRLQAVVKAMFLGLINPPSVRNIIELPG